MDGSIKVSQSYVYIRTNELCHAKNMVKLGITSISPKIREYGYTTYEHIKGHYIAIYEIEKTKLHFIDNLLKYEFKKYNNYVNSGTEYYHTDIIDKIEPYLKSIKIQYKIIDINKMDAIQREEQFQNIKDSLRKKGVLQKLNDLLLFKIMNKKIEDKKLSEWHLRDYQNEAISHGYELLLRDSRFYLNLPTGGGKSFIVYNIIRQLIQFDSSLDLILIISPRKIVNSQNISEKYTKLLQPQVSNTYNYSDGNKNIFKKFLKTLTPNSSIINILIICTSSIDKIYNDVKDLNMCIWFDEAHYGIESWLLPSKLFSSKLFSSKEKETKEELKETKEELKETKKELKETKEELKETKEELKAPKGKNKTLMPPKEEKWLHIGKYNIFTSASPDQNIIKANKDIFGELYSPIKVNELIKSNWLCPIVPYVYMENIKKVNKIKFMLREFTDKHKNYGFSFHNSRANAFELFYFHYLEYTCGNTTIKPYLLIGDDFFSFTKKALTKEDDEIIKALSNIKLDYNYRDIKEFESRSNSIGYVVAKYSMGYDFNQLDFIAFNDPKLSFKDIIQCIGRGIRPDQLGLNGANLYKYLMILLPIYYDETSNDSESIKYRNIKKVLQYLLYDVELNFSDIWFVDRVRRNTKISKAVKNSEDTDISGDEADEYCYYKYDEHTYDAKYRKLGTINVLSTVLNLLEEKKEEEKLEIKNYDFTSSTIQAATLIFSGIEHKPSKLKYKTVRDVVYRLIGDSSTIIQNAKINIVKENRTDKGFEYMEDLQISIQGVDSNTCLYEIVNQCKKNNITLKMQIKLKNSEIINVEY